MSTEPTLDKCFFCLSEAQTISIYDRVYGWVGVCKHCYMDMVVREPEEEEVLI